MKKLLTTLAISACLVTLAYAQGAITFDTSAAAGVNARVLMPNGTPVGSTAAGAPAGSLFLAQLYFAAGSVTDSASLVPAGNPVNLRSGTSAGFSQITGTTSLGVLVDPTVVVPTIPGGALATIQMRAWWAGPGGNTYTQYYEYNGPPNGLFGASPLLVKPLGAGGTPPSPPADLVGLQGFTLIPVPEPTTWALLGLGAAALWIFRRRN